MDYVNPSAIVETSWLADHLNDPHIVILDASWHLPTVDRNALGEYREGHIPGAHFFDIDAVSDQTSNLPHMLPREDDFSAYVSALGIDNQSQVIVYDSYGLFSAARAWWMFRAFGHDKVSVLNGGLVKWQREDRPVTGHIPSPDHKSFKAVLRPELVQSIDDVKASVRTGDRNILDARSVARFHGNAPEPREGIRSGHIPGSKCLPFDQLLHPQEKTLLSASDIRDLVRQTGMDDDRAVTCTCGTGVTACALALGLHLIGKDDVAVYDGSWTEWGGRDDTTIEL